MLIEFRFRNFKSFRDEQTLSMAAALSKDDRRPGISRVKLAGRIRPILNVASIFGPNAAGKSSVIQAARTMTNIVKQSAVRFEPTSSLPISPFRLDENSDKRPTFFEMTFCCDDTMYTLRFEATREKIVTEELIAFPQRKAQVWYRRLEDGTMEFPSRNLRGDRLQLKELTRPNALFISTAAQFNSKQLTPLYEWFAKRVRFIDAGNADGPAIPYTIGRILKDEDIARRLQSDIRKADLGIVQVRGKERAASTQLSLQKSSEKVREAFSKFIESMGDSFVERGASFTHKGSGGKEVEFELHDESLGTRKLFGLLGYWYDALERGRVLFVDELGSSMHPLLSKHLIEMFMDAGINKKRGQLVYTTHDITHLDPAITERDQVWLAEKANDGASKLTPLLVYKPRKDESMARGYLRGRYGAIPMIEGNTP